MSLRALLAKDLRVEWRSRDTLAPLLTVALLVALVGDVAFDGLAVQAAAVVSATLWTAVVFGAQVGLARSFVVERDRGTLDGMLAAPVDTRAVFASKLIANLLVLAIVVVVATAGVAVFFHLDPAAWVGPGAPALLAVIVLGTVGIGLVTTLAATMAMHGRSWILLVPLLSLPALFPVLAGAVPATTALLAGAPVAAAAAALRLLVAFDIVVLAASWVLVPFLLEA